MSAGITMSATSTRLLTCADCLGPGPDSETRTMNGRGPQKDEDHRGRAPQRARTTKERGPAGEAGGPARGCSEVLRCAPGACQMVPMTSEAPGTSDSGREAGPTYLALGRTSRPVRFCSRMCAAQPAVRAQVNIEVNMWAGTSAKSSTTAAQYSTLVASTRSG